MMVSAPSLKTRYGLLYVGTASSMSPLTGSVKGTPTTRYGHGCDPLVSTVEVLGWPQRELTEKRKSEAPNIRSMTTEIRQRIVGAGMAGSSPVFVRQNSVPTYASSRRERVQVDRCISAGLIWSYETIDDARENVPRGDPELQRTIVEGSIQPSTGSSLWV